MDHDILASEDFKRKQYFHELNLHQVRDIFRIKSQMYGDFKGSFPSKFRTRGISLKCDLCKNILDSNTSLDDTSEQNMESQKHFLEVCPQVLDIRSQVNTDNILG